MFEIRTQTIITGYMVDLLFKYEPGTHIFTYLRCVIPEQSE